jgi:hypothetical protein
MRQVDREELDLTTYATGEGEHKAIVHVVTSSRNRLSILKGEAAEHFWQGYRLAGKKEHEAAIEELDTAADQRLIHSPAGHSLP